MKRDLIVFAEDWGGLPSSTQHLILRLSSERKILWVNSIGLRQPKFCKQDALRLLQKIKAFFSTSGVSKGSSVEQLEIPKNFKVISPLTLPAPRSSVARWIASQLLARQVKASLKQWPLNQPIFWSSLPTAVDLIGPLGAEQVVYYCGDDFAALNGVDHQVVSRREKEIVSRADLTLVASQTLLETLQGKNCRLLSHGVDFHRFSTEQKAAKDLPKNGRPIAGFYGSLSAWIDYPLIRQLALCMPHWDFVLIGNADTNLDDLMGLKNVYLLGPRSHQCLPSYVQHWTASLLPFLDTAQIRACNPLKLREYLAAGQPVVSTRFPQAEAYGSLIAIADDLHAMVQKLEEARYTNNEEKIRRQNAVREETWDARAAELDKWLDQL